MRVHNWTERWIKPGRALYHASLRTLEAHRCWGFAREGGPGAPGSVSRFLGARGHSGAQGCGIWTKAKLHGPSGLSELGGSPCRLEMEWTPLSLVTVCGSWKKGGWETKWPTWSRRRHHGRGEDTWWLTGLFRVSHEPLRSPPGWAHTSFHWLPVSLKFILTEVSS